MRRAFRRPLGALGIELVAPAPRRGADVVAGYRAALDAAAGSAPVGSAPVGSAPVGSAPVGSAGPLLVGGISLGAHVAARWASTLPPGSPVCGLLLALPAWSGPAGAAPAALAARATAALVRDGGVTAALTAARAGSPAWLAAELGRAWPRYGDGLAPALEAAAAEPGPDPAALRALDLPAGIAALVDDPVHPLAEAQEWQRLLPRAALLTAPLATFGADPEVIGRAAVLGWLRATR